MHFNFNSNQITPESALYKVKAVTLRSWTWYSRTPNYRHCGYWKVGDHWAWAHKIIHVLFTLIWLYLTNKDHFMVECNVHISLTDPSSEVLVGEAFYIRAHSAQSCWQFDLWTSWMGGVCWNINFKFFPFHL